MQPTWKQAEVFPLIARIIRQTWQEQDGYVSSHRIASQLLLDSEGRRVIQQAQDQQEEKQSLDWLASNMVAWFGQRITVGKSEWADQFDRVKVDGQLAYRPADRRATP